MSRPSPSAARVRELHALRPDRMKVVPGADGWPEAYEYTVAGRTRALRAARRRPACAPILHLKLFHPVNDHYGLSRSRPRPRRSTSTTPPRAGTRRCSTTRRGPPARSSMPAADGQLTAEQFERLKAELETSFQGAAQRRPAAAARRRARLEVDVAVAARTWTSSRPSTPPRARSRWRFGVPPMLLGIPGDNTYSNYQEANRSFWRQTVLPLVNRTAKALSGWLAPAFGLDSAEPRSRPGGGALPRARGAVGAARRRHS